MNNKKELKNNTINSVDLYNENNITNDINSQNDNILTNDINSHNDNILNNGINNDINNDINNGINNDINNDIINNLSNTHCILIKPNILINENLNEIKIRIIAHTTAAMIYEKREKYLGYPITILSSFLSSTIMLEISNKNNEASNLFMYISLGLSVFSFLLSISRQYFDYAKKFQSHDLSSKLYTTLLRSVEVRLIKNHIDSEERRDIFKDIVDQMSIIEQYETPIPKNINKKIRNGYSSLHFQFA